MQKVVRTYPLEQRVTQQVSLADLLEEGFTIVHCSPIKSKDGSTCNEYIVEKKDS